jgi:ABC-type multidrug transport system ATPase subunit
MLDFTDVTLTDVSRHFGRRRAVSHVSLTAHARDIIGLLGPNGAGKSTLIGMLATLVTPTSGTIAYGGRSARDLGSALRASIGLLAHEPSLYSDLTARQNLALFAGLYGLAPDGPVDLVDRALATAGLSERADDVVSAFSRGMRQRLALERTLLHKPTLVLLDEPFTGLDDAAVSKVSGRLKQLASEGTIVVLATHDLDLADGLVTRVAIVRGGKLIAPVESGVTGLRGRYRELVHAGARDVR